MQNLKTYVTHQIFSWIVLAIYAGAFIGDLSLAFTLNSIAMRIIYVIMAILMFGLIRVRLFEIQALKRIRQQALILAEWGDPVAANHGTTISEVMMNTRNEDVEYVSFFTEEGQKLCESTINCPTITIVRDEDKALVLQHPNGVMVHNHPGDEPIAFSPEDLTYLATGVCQKSIVVTSSFCYVMEAPKGFCMNPNIVRRLGRKFYRGSSPSEASFNFCLEVAARLGWSFGIMMPMFATIHEETEENN